MEPTKEDLQNPVFEAIWQVIKKWDICRESDWGRSLYSGATGTDVKEILDAIDPFIFHYKKS